MFILFVFLVLENVFEKYIPQMSYFDEIITIALLIMTILKICNSRVHQKRYIKIYMCLGAVLLIGFLSTFIYQVQDNMIAVLKDALAVSKFFVVYVYAAEYIKIKNPKKVLKNIELFSKGYIFILFVFGLINQIADIGMDSGYRGVIKTYLFMYTHATFMVASIVIVCTMLIAGGWKKNMSYLTMATVILVMSMRAKAFIYIASVVLFCIIIRSYMSGKIRNIWTRKIRRRVSIAGVFIAVAVYFISREKISAYMMWGLAAARPALYIVGFQILQDFFPLGSGFATFASTLSGKYYSPLYLKYGIQNTSGLMRSEGYPYIADTYWPYVFAQFGLFGAVFYMLGLVGIFKDVLQHCKINMNCLIASFALFIYLIASCFVETMLTNAPVVLSAFTLGYYIRIQCEVSRGIK